MSEKSTIAIEIDTHKLIALQFAYKDKDVTIEQELARAADSMYARTAEKTKEMAAFMIEAVSSFRQEMVEREQPQQARQGPGRPAKGKTASEVVNSTGEQLKGQQELER